MPVTRENLPIGDIIISLNGSPMSIIERKTWVDLSASIKDGRYKEQAFRLGQSPLNNHRITFLIEGSLTKYPKGPRLRYLDRSTLLSAMVSLNYDQGFSTHRTQNTAESAEWILNLAKKIRKIHNHPNSDVSVKTGYTSVLPLGKQKYLTPKNICSIMLAQIPGVGNAKARAITRTFSTLPKLIQALQSNPDALNPIQITSSTNRSLKLDQKTKSRIYEYLHINSVYSPD